MMELPWEGLQVSGINYTAPADAMQEIADLRADVRRRARMTGPDGRMLINLSPIAQATSDTIGLESVSKRSATFGVPATHFAGYAPPAPAEPARVWLHGADEIQGRIERHHQHMARLDELARLQAREEHSARTLPNAAPVLRLVPAHSQLSPAPTATYPVASQTEKVWTEERKAEARAYRAKHGLKKTAEYYGVSQATISKHIPAGKAKVDALGPWAGLAQK